MTVRRFRPAAGTRLDGGTLIGGSPLRLFRLTDAGRDLVERIAAGDPVPVGPLVERLLDADAVHPVPDADASPFGPADVTVVVPALGPPPTPPPEGAIVVDDGSDPPIDGAAVRLDANRGPAAARNAGLEVVTTPLVAFVDTDVTLTPRWLDGLLAHFDDERVALVAPRVAAPPDADGQIGAHERRHGALDLGTEPARVRAGGRVGHVPAAAVLARVDAVRAVGGFDEGLRFGEDVDLVWRLDAAGWRVRYEPTVVVHHAPRATWAAWVRQHAGYGSSAAPLARRHPGALAPVRLGGWSVAAWVSAVVVHPAVAVAIALGTGGALTRRLRTVSPRVAFGLAVRGNLHAGAQLAHAVRRAWWPILAVASIRSSHARRVVAASFLAAGDPLVAVADVAYSIGVWRGMWRERHLGPIVPDITSWPPKRGITRRPWRHRSAGSGRYRATT